MKGKKSVLCGGFQTQYFVFSILFNLFVKVPNGKQVKVVSAKIGHANI